MQLSVNVVQDAAPYTLRQSLESAPGADVSGLQKGAGNESKGSRRECKK